MSYKSGCMVCGEKLGYFESHVSASCFYCWTLNETTVRCLQVIAMEGGPRCCKRDSFLAITTAAEFLWDEFGVSLDIDQPVQCTFSNLNGECLFEECLYHYHGGE